MSAVMASRWRSVLIPALLVLCTAALYVPGLQRAPAHLSNDEVCIALNARAIAATGRDFDGRFMPALFYSPKFYAFNGVRIWFLPLLVYATAIVLKVLPFTETAIRLPLVIAAIADVLLVYFIARALFEQRRLAILAAILLALTPAHFTHARLALPAQISGPFVLGWLLCVLLYFRRLDPRLLFAAGVLLGLAAIGYIGPLVAVYGLLTCLVLYQRRAPWRHYASLIAGGLVPCLYFLWLLRDPAVAHDIFGHYRQPENGIGPFARAAGVAALYWNFWSPRFLFVEGAVRNARTLGIIGVFLLPMAGLLALGLLRAARRLTPQAMLLLGGFFSAPVPASFVGEGHAIWRALEVAPFGVLLAAYGLEQLLAEDTARARWMAFVTTFAIAISLAVIYHDDLVHAQPMIRVLIVPLAVAALATLFGWLTDDTLALGPVAVVAVTLLCAQAAYVAAHANLVHVAVVMLAVIIGLARLPGGQKTSMISNTPARSAPGNSPLRYYSDGLLLVTLLALLVSEFLYFHVDYPAVRRIAWVPASALLLALRLVVAGALLPPVLLVVRRLRRASAGQPDSMRFVIVTSLAVVVLQLAYFYVDYSTDTGVRLVYVSAVLLLAVSLAAVLSAVAPSRQTVARLGVVALFTAAFLQFGYFYADYFTGYQIRSFASSAGNARGVLEQVIEQTRERPAPAIFVGTVGPYGDAGLYWRFYLIKHHREDLLARTIEGQPFERNRLRQLPGGSLLITSPSAEVDRTIEQMEDAGELRRDGSHTLIRTPDGTPLFWVLERTASE